MKANMWYTYWNTQLYEDINLFQIDLQILYSTNQKYRYILFTFCVWN